MCMLVRYLELSSITYTGDLDYSVNVEKNSETSIGKIRKETTKGRNFSLSDTA